MERGPKRPVTSGMAKDEAKFFLSISNSLPAAFTCPVPHLLQLARNASDFDATQGLLFPRKPKAAVRFQSFFFHPPPSTLGPKLLQVISTQLLQSFLIILFSIQRTGPLGPRPIDNSRRLLPPLRFPYLSAVPLSRRLSLLLGHLVFPRRAGRVLKDIG